MIGVYFADTFEKSYNYCMGNFGYFSSFGRSTPMKCIFLCEVALGKMKELKQAEFISKLPCTKTSLSNNFPMIYDLE